jgi:hypothetical protein
MLHRVALAPQRRWRAWRPASRVTGDEKPPFGGPAQGLMAEIVVVHLPGRPSSEPCLDLGFYLACRSATCIWCRISQRLPPGRRFLSLLRAGRRAVGRGGGGSRPQVRLPSPRAGAMRLVRFVLRSSPRRLRRTVWAPRHAGIGRAKAAAVPRRLRADGAERAEPAAEAIDEAAAGHIKVVERVVAGGVERGDERHDEGGVHSGGVEDREQFGELVGLLGSSRT